MATKATPVVTTNTTPAEVVTKAKREKKAPVPAVTQIVKVLKARALQGKLSVENLDTISNLAIALKAFITA